MMRQLGLFRHNLGEPPAPGTKVVLRTERGVELGQVVLAACKEASPGCITHDRLGEFLEASGPDYPFRKDGKVLRLANVQDIIDHRHLDSSAVDEAAFCRQQIKELGLKMKLVTVEHLLGGERIIFYFSAEQRVDFRQLVRRLAAQFRTRIEMRQVGARDEARLVADYERCGMQCCCQQFLKDLKPVSMRMAKTQKATLDPSKISGRCGRLMCCLRYEDAGYEELRQKLPKKNIWVQTADYVGRVTETQILTQLVRLALPNDSQVVVGNEEILERDVTPPPPEEPAAKTRDHAPRRARIRAEPRLLRDQVVADQDAAVEKPEPQAVAVAKAEPADTPAQPDKAAREPQAQQTPKAEEARSERRPPRRRRGRRRTKKKRTAHAASEQPRRGPAETPPKSQPQPSAAPVQEASAAQGAKAQDSAKPTSAEGDGKKPARKPRRRRNRRRRKKRS